MRPPKSSNSLEFPDLEEEFGEEAVRDAVSTLHRDHIGRVDAWLRDDTIMARIRGIDFLDRIQVFAAVENRTRGREKVLEALADRREELEEIGERDERLEDVERRPIEEIDEEDDQEDSVWIHEPCSTVVKQNSAMAWFCPACEVRTNRVVEIEGSTNDETNQEKAIADGGEET